jgi:hypothetical protein
MPNLFGAPHGPSLVRNIQVPQRLRQIFASGIYKAAHVPLGKVVVPSVFLCDHDTPIVSWISWPLEQCQSGFNDHHFPSARLIIIFRTIHARTHGIFPHQAGTQVPYKACETPSSLLRAVPALLHPQIIAMGIPLNAQMQQQQSLLVAFTREEIPFICVKGTFEYHTNPAHTADSWFSYRGKGNEGSLYYLLNVLYQYGTAPITDYAVQPVVKGFVQGELPK